MMPRPDPDDMQDVRFYLQREPAIGVAELQAAFAQAVGTGGGTGQQHE